MRKFLATVVTSVVLLTSGALPVQAEPTANASSDYLLWLDDRMRLWPLELNRIERSPVASAQEVESLKTMMRETELEARAVTDGQQLSQTPIQLRVLSIETELERLASEMERLPVLAGPISK